MQLYQTMFVTHSQCLFLNVYCLSAILQINLCVLLPNCHGYTVSAISPGISSMPICV